jgi:hypothetical protein
MIYSNRAEHIPDQWFPEWRCPRCGESDRPVVGMEHNNLARRNGTAVGLGARADRGWHRTGPYNSGDITPRRANVSAGTS